MSLVYAGQVHLGSCFSCFSCCFFWCVLAHESCRARTDADAFVLTELKSYRIGRARLASVSFAIVIASAPSIYLYPSISLSLSSIPSFRSAVLRRRYISLCSSFSCSCRVVSSRRPSCSVVVCPVHRILLSQTPISARPVPSHPVPSRLVSHTSLYTRALGPGECSAAGPSAQCPALTPVPVISTRCRRFYFRYEESSLAFALFL